MPTKQENLAEADALATLDWFKHTPYHWSIRVGWRRADYWPSTRRFRWSASRGRRATLYMGIKEAEAQVRKHAPDAYPGDLPYYVCSAPGCHNGGPTCNKHTCPRIRL